MHPSEFPVEPPILFLDSALLAGIVLLVLVVAVLAYYLGKRDGRGTRDERRREVPGIIHEAIRARCVAATRAPPGEMLDTARDLLEEVRWRLGPVLAYGGPYARALNGMADALEGEPVAHDGGKGDTSGRGRDDGPGGAREGAELELAAANPTIPGDQALVLTGLRPGLAPGAKSGEEESKVLDPMDYSRQVRMAVVEFSDFWSRDDCLNELERCQKALTQTAAAAKTPSEGR
jgi:hypothetical protein